MNSSSHLLGSWTIELLKVIGILFTCALILFACEEPGKGTPTPSTAIKQNP